jgi:gamma-glutamyltranspeptidase/glutathione hydrolase
LAEPGVKLGREGVEVTREQAYFHEILEPILTSTPEGAALYAPEGKPLAAGETFRFPEAGQALERFAAEGAAPFYTGEVARRVVEWVRERGGTLGVEDMAAYEPIEREPVRARFRGAEVLTNPPPSSGGILIAYALAVLEGLGDSTGVEQIVTATEAANEHRTDDFAEGLHDGAYVNRFLGDHLGSTTHIAVLDEAGMCASVTCSNGTGSGLIVPGTGVHVNNMLGEEDLNPGGFGVLAPGARMTSMMAPTLLLRGDDPVLALGSAGSNRLRSAILQTVISVVDGGLQAGEAVRRPRVHPEGDGVDVEGGVPEEAAAALHAEGHTLRRWGELNLFFGGVSVVARGAGGLEGAGDPRRGGAAAAVTRSGEVITL